MMHPASASSAEPITTVASCSAEYAVRAVSPARAKASAMTGAWARLVSMST